MDRKVKNTIILVILLLFIVLTGSAFTLFYQKGKISDKTGKLEKMRLETYDTDELLDQLASLQVRAAQLDSILALRKYNIPVNLAQSRFYDFVNRVSFSFSSHSFVNIEYQDAFPDANFRFYVYKVSGTATFNDLFSLVYAIEESKELKKVLTAQFNNFVKVDDNEVPHFLVSYTMEVAVYFSDNDHFASTVRQENRLKANPLYDVFYPLIRNEIPPNRDMLLDVQNAQLLALIPDGAYLADDSGRTYLLWEGDAVYLGYLTKINYNTNEVSFILNIGGLIEKVTLTLEKEKKSEKIQ